MRACPAFSILPVDGRADMGMHLGDIGRRGGLAGADRPDRLVGDDGIGRRSRRPGIEPVELRPTTSSALPASRCSSVSPTQMIGDQARRMGGRRLGRYQGVGLRRGLPALGMADDDMRGSRHRPASRR